MDTTLRPRVPLSGILTGIAVLGLLYATRSVSYTLFHSLAELFAIIVAACVFMVMWNSRRFVENGALLFIGFALLSIASIDVLHMLTYAGMGVVPGVDADTPTQLWIIGRVMQAVVMVMAPAFLSRQIHGGRLVVAWAVPTVVLASIVFATDWFPACLGPDGLTTFKIAAEWAVSVTLAVALVRFWRRSSHFRPDVLRLLSHSIVVTIASELMFTLYTDAYGPFNLLGHFLRIVAFYLLYRAIIATALSEPHSVLFKELAERNEALAISEATIRQAKAFSDAMNDIDTSMNSTLELDEVLSRTIVQATTAMHADAAAISLREGDAWVVRYVYHMPDSLVGVRRDRDTGRHLFATAESRRPLIVNDTLDDDRVSTTFAQEYGVRSLMTVPLMSAGEAIGVLSFYGLSGERTFSDEQLDFGSRLAVSLALAIENARLYDAQRQIAEQLQAPILSFPDELSGVTFGHAYRSVEELAKIGGDFYDAFELGDGRIAVVIGDVAGKGMTAATASSITRTTFRAFGLHERTPAAVLRAVNNVLVHLLPEESFATATYGVIDIGADTMTAASAGHPDPFVCTPAGCRKQDAQRNQPLGLWQGTEFDEFTVELHRGDSIVLFSDGLLDTRRGKEFFGEERVADVLDPLRDSTPQEIVDALMRAAGEFSGTQHTDDIAVIAATIRR
ncbi:MAG: MASE3 domain-containing protein [Coriobacteriia bacterium]